MLSESTTNIRKALRRYHIHQYIMTLFDDNPILREIVSSDKFPITNVERIYEYKDGLDFLGISFATNGRLDKRLDLNEINIRIRYIVEEIINDLLNSRIFNREADKKEYLDSLKALTNIFDFTKQLSEDSSPIFEDSPKADKELVTGENKLLFDEDDNPLSKDEYSTEVVESQKTSKMNRYKLFYDKEWNTGIFGIDNIFRTIKTLKCDKHIDVVGIAFRCYLDMIIYEFLKKRNSLTDASLQDNAKTNIENEKLFKRIKKYLVDEFVISENEIKDEFRYILKLGIKTEISKSLSLRGMLIYISKKQDLFPDNRQRNTLEAFFNGNNNIIDLQGFNMLVHNQNCHIEYSQLENTVKNLLPLLEHVNHVITNE